MRSLLFVPGDSEKKLDKAQTSGADALIIDLEDSIAPERKADGRFLDPYRLARSLCLAAAAAAEVQAIDTVYVDFRDPAGLRRKAEEARRDGFTAKIAIHPGQVDVINAVFTPAADAIAK